MSQYRNLETRHPREGSLREHKAILAALTIRSREAAEAAMRLHLSQTRHGLKIKLEDG
jgi:DNA-binding GntR family transcriptional regulator